MPSSVPEEDLLRMSLTGELPPATQASFDEAKAQGNAAFRAADYALAIRHYTLAERLNPLSPLPPANRAQAHLKLRAWHAAKADASVALELHAALPPALQPPALPVKALLRRAAANEQLLLYALAADDYAHILRRDPANKLARENLARLKQRFAVSPSPLSPTHPPDSPDPKITLLSSSPTSPTSAPSRPSRTSPPAPPHPTTLQDETALLDLPPSVIHRLVSRWTASPPANASEFERAWKTLKIDPPSRAHYLLRTVGAPAIRAGLLGDSLTPQLLEDFVQVLSAAVTRNPSEASDVAHFLHALTTVARFDMLLMFLSPQEKQPIDALLNILADNAVPHDRVAALRKCYS